MADGERIPTNLRTLLILEALAKADEPLTPTQINQSIGLPKQSIHRLCQTLVDEGFLIRDTSGNRLRPAPRTFDMAIGILQSRHLLVARRQILTRIAQTVRETVNYVVPELDGMIYLDRVETDWLFRIELPIGSHVPFYCTASGKCFLASLTGKRRDDILSTMQIGTHTANTHKTVESLARELDEIAEQEYALDNEEFFDGMVALAVPVLDADGRFAAALAFHGPTQRLNRDRLLSQLDIMREGARDIAALHRHPAG